MVYINLTLMKISTIIDIICTVELLIFLDIVRIIKSCLQKKPNSTN
jgi:hypothetical protein